ncbi:MAG TPA: hypothetical protein VGB83_06520 [Actinomycetota bacterium]
MSASERVVHVHIDRLVVEPGAAPEAFEHALREHLAGALRTAGPIVPRSIARLQLDAGSPQPGAVGAAVARGVARSLS